LSCFIIISPGIQQEADNFIIAKYAYGKDYHSLVKEKVMELGRFIRFENPDCSVKSFVDSGPVMEKAWAQRAGVGWTGKNTILINRQQVHFSLSASS